jgi:hypothetical protein
MKWLLAGCAAVVLSTGAAFAGPCSQQITELQRSLSSHDAGSGPVLTNRGVSSQNQVSEAGSASRSTSEASRNPAQVRTQNQTGRVGPTEAVSGATAGSAASAQDVRRQQQGEPTQAAAAYSGTAGATTREDKLQKVNADLERARSLDAKNDQACLSAVDEAKKRMATD